MQCDECREREAVIALTQIVDEQVTTLHLCEKCAASRGVESQALAAKTPLGSFLAAMGKEMDEEGGVAAATTACPHCGATLADFREVGRLGCPICYDAFGRALRDLLRRIHGSVRHVGERYAAPGVAAHSADASVLVDLQKQLRDAVNREDFERAAELRDQLRALE